MYQPRVYRESLAHREGVRHFHLVCRETDLLVSLPEGSFSPQLVSRLESHLQSSRRLLEEYLARHPLFARSLKPCPAAKGAPALVTAMARAAAAAEVGPMAAVAGALAQEAGDFMYSRLQVPAFIVENGGDIYARWPEPMVVSIYAGSSFFSQKIGVKIYPEQMPLGICTSAGTVGHSFSLGRADAAVVTAASAYLADAFATSLANRVKKAADIEEILVEDFPEIQGIVLIMEDRLGVKGQLELIPLE